MLLLVQGAMSKMGDASSEQSMVRRIILAYTYVGVWIALSGAVIM